MRSAISLSLVALLGFLPGCGGDDEDSLVNPGPDAGTDAASDVALPDSPFDAPSEADAQDVGTDVVPIDAAEDAEPDAPDGSTYPEPTPSDISFQAVNAIPSGEYLLFNDWNPSPNSVSVVSLDGQTTTEIFRAYRIWSLGVSRGNDRIAFACGDPNQAQNYGIQLGDAIQHTWIYDIAAQTAEVVAYGNINDECHLFGPKDDYLYVCRRYDFGGTLSNPTYKGWRIGRLDLESLDFEFLVPEQDAIFSLHPQPTLDESEMYYGLIDVPASPPSGVRSIQKKSLPSGNPSTVREKADNPMLSPDGTKYLYRNYEDSGTLWSSSLDGTTTFQIVDAQASEPVWSSDGTRVAYLLRDNANNCDHIEVVASDGSEATTPFRVRDCAGTGEFITELEWVVVP